MQFMYICKVVARPCETLHCEARSLSLLMMPRISIIALATIPAVWAIAHSDGTGRLPAMGWNSWVGDLTSCIAFISIAKLTRQRRMHTIAMWTRQR